MESQTPKPVAYLVRVATGVRSGVWVIFDAERILYGAAGESRRALQIRWRKAGSACPTIQRRPDVLTPADVGSLISQTRMRLAGGVVQNVPQYFTDCCAAARKRTARTGYQHPGHELARRLAAEKPASVDREFWNAELQQLRWLAEQGDNAAMLTWFDAHFTACMTLIPRRRRKAFLRGVYSGLAAGGAA